MKRKGLIKLFSILAAEALTAASLTGCGAESADTGREYEASSSAEAAGQNSNGEMQAAVAANAEAVTLLVYDELFTDRDLSGTYDAAEAISILLSGSTASCDSDGVSISGSTVTVTEAGIYILSGTLTEGMVVVEAADTEKVQLVLDGADISNGTNAAIYVKEADKVFITLAEGKQNTLVSRGYTVLDGNNIDGCIFSKSDLIINGAGSLTINAAEGHGIVSKDDLKVTGGSLNVTAAGHGLSGKDSVCIADGTITVNSGKDGIHSENADDASKGYVYVAGGSLTLTSARDGIDAGTIVQLDGGSCQITAGGGSGSKTVQAEDGTTVSAKGVKTGGRLVVNEGSLVIDSQDDALHSNTDVILNGGSLQLSSGDDGIHGDETVTVAGGSITIDTGYEGIEGSDIIISGGYIKLYATDDGINAAGGNDGSGFSGWSGGDSFGSSSDYSVEISGGELYINAEGDGIDSNGNFIMSGGRVYISGSVNGGNGALDYNGTGEITGGVIVAVGASQMAMNFGSTSTQGAALLTAGTCPAGTEIVVEDAEGKELVTYTSEKTFDSVLVSSPEFIQGGTYTVRIGDEEQTVIFDSLIYGRGGGVPGENGTSGKASQ